MCGCCAADDSAVWKINDKTEDKYQPVGSRLHSSDVVLGSRIGTEGHLNQFKLNYKKAEFKSVSRNSSQFFYAPFFKIDITKVVVFFVDGKRAKPRRTIGTQLNFCQKFKLNYEKVILSCCAHHQISLTFGEKGGIRLGVGQCQAKGPRASSTQMVLCCGGRTPRYCRGMHTHNYCAITR